MTVGTVRWSDVSKGYRFLKPDDGGVDVLVSICALERAGMAIENEIAIFRSVDELRLARRVSSQSGIQFETPPPPKTR